MKIPKNAWYGIGLLGIGLLIFLAKIKSTMSEPTTEERVAIAKERYLEELAEKEQAIAVLDSRVQESLSAGERYVGGFLLSDHVDMRAAHYVEICEQLDEYAGACRTYEKDADAALAKRAQELGKKLKALRVKIMPQLRKRWVTASDNQLWENDIDARCLGSGNTIVEFTGGTFAANANIKTAQDGISDALRKLRFKQSRYKWYSGDDEYTYYKIESAADGEM